MSTVSTESLRFPAPGVYMLPPGYSLKLHIGTIVN